MKEERIRELEQLIEDKETEFYSSISDLMDELSQLKKAQKEKAQKEIKKTLISNVKT